MIPEDEYANALYLLQTWIPAELDSPMHGTDLRSTPQDFGRLFAKAESQAHVQSALVELRRLRRDSRWNHEELAEISNWVQTSRPQALAWMAELIGGIEHGLAERQANRRGRSSLGKGRKESQGR